MNNSAAAEILTDMISKGHVKQNADGSLSALKELEDNDNIIHHEGDK